jgi:hypothetical protein
MKRASRRSQWRIVSNEAFRIGVARCLRCAWLGRHTSARREVSCGIDHSQTSN